MAQLDLAHSGEALFKVRGKFLAYTIVLGTVIAYFNGQIGPFATAAGADGFDRPCAAPGA